MKSNHKLKDSVLKLVEIKPSTQVFLVFVCAVVIVLMLQQFTLQIHAGFINFPENFDGLTGINQFMSSSYDFALDVLPLSWNDAAESVAHGIATFFLIMYESVVRIFVLTYYHAMSFDLLTLLKPLVSLIMTNINKTFMTDMNGFLTGGVLISVMIYSAKQNYTKVWKSIMTAALIIAVSKYVLAEHDTLLTNTVDTVTAVNSAVITSMSGSDAGAEVTDPIANATGTFWYSLFVQPYREINGGGKLDDAELLRLVSHPAKSSEREAVIRELNETYPGIFARDYGLYFGRAGQILVVFVVVMIEMFVILALSMLQLFLQLMLILLFSLLPFVFFASAIDILGGPQVLTRYGYNALKYIVSAMLISLLIGFMSAVDIAITNNDNTMTWIVLLVLKGGLYIVLYQKHEMILSELSSIIGIRPHGMHGRMQANSHSSKTKGQPTREQMDYARELEDSVGVKKPRRMAKMNQKQMNRYTDALRRKDAKLNGDDRSRFDRNSRFKRKDGANKDETTNGSPLNTKAPETPVNRNSPKATAKQMAYARDLERRGGHKAANLDVMSASDISSYITGLKTMKPLNKETPNVPNGNPTQSEDAPQENTKPTPFSPQEIQQIKTLESSTARKMRSEASKHDLNLDQVNIDKMSSIDKESLQFDIQAGYAGNLSKYETNSRKEHTANKQHRIKNQYSSDLEAMKNKYKAK